MIDGQKEFLINKQNFRHSESTWEVEERISHKEIIGYYFKKSSDKKPPVVQMLVGVFNVCMITV